MAKRIKYIGLLDRYFELPITGKQSVWGRGDTDIREDAEADLLIATGDFTQVSDTSSIAQATDLDITTGTSTTPMLTSPEQLVLAVKTHAAANDAQGYPSITLPGGTVQRLGIRYKSGVPLITPGNGYVGANGKVQLGNSVAKTLAVSATSGSVTCTAGGGAPFTSAAVDVGQAITLDNGKSILITAFTSATVVTGTVQGGALSATSFASGAWTYGAPLPNSTWSLFVGKNGSWVYFPAGALYAGSALGTYFVIWDTPTYGTVYDNTMYAAGSPIVGTPAIPLTTNPIVSSVIGNYTQPTTEIQLCKLSVPAGFLGEYGEIEAVLTHSCNNLSIGANTKSFIARLDSLGIWYGGFTNNAKWVKRLINVNNTGAENRQFSSDAASATPVGFGVGANVFGNINTAAETFITIRHLHAASAAIEPMVTNAFTVEIKPSWQ